MGDRPNIPKGIKEEVEKEFNHRCAKCGNDNPQIHHIDNDSANNDILNLIPLCPNCHLIDQHNPTKAYPQNLIKIFRQYKDPLIFSSKFYPIYSRMDFLLCEPGLLTTNVSKDVSELCSFISTFKKGEYYGKKVGSLLRYSRHARAVDLNDPSSFRNDAEDKNELNEFVVELEKNRSQAIDLIIEQIRYQDWDVDPKKSHNK